jgi:hypothetical protein
LKNGILLCAIALISSNFNAIANDAKLSNFIGIGISGKSGSSVALKFTPPDETGWSEKNSGLSVTLKNSNDSEDNNREIEAYLMRVDAPISPISGYIETMRRNILEGVANSKRFKVIALEIAEDSKDARCVRLHLLLEGIEAEQVTKQKRWNEQYALSCGLLKRKGLGFELRFYHRYLDSNKDLQFREKAVKIMESVVIQDD